MNPKLDLIARIEILYLELIPAIRNFPKDQRFTLAQNIEYRMLEIVADFYAGSFDRGRREECFLGMRRNMHVTVFLLRVSRKLGYLSEGLYEKFTRELIELGKITTSWIKKVKEGAA